MGKGEGPVLHFLSIDEGEGLRGNGGNFATFAGIGGAGLVEGFEKGIAKAAKFFGVKAASITLFWEWVGFVDGGGAAHDLERLAGDLEIDVGPGRETSDFGVKLATGNEHGVAEFLGGEASGYEYGVEFLAWVGLFEESGIWVAGATLVGFGRGDELVELFDGPSVFDKPVSEEV